MRHSILGFAVFSRIVDTAHFESWFGGLPPEEAYLLFFFRREAWSAHLDAICLRRNQIFAMRSGLSRRRHLRVPRVNNRQADENKIADNSFSLQYD